jgi:hypothetical protein
VTRSELVLLFPSSDPVEVERAMVRAMKQLNVSGDALDHGQILAILDAMASASGVVGVAARFAKARALLLPKRAAAAKR